MIERETLSSQVLLRRIRVLIVLFIVGLVVSGATAIPLEWELGLLAGWFPIAADGGETAYNALAHWLHKIHDAVAETNARHPQLAYGTDWLAFGHFVIAISFVGPLRDPVRNIWMLTFGMIAALLVIPYALVFGALREIPIWWRLIDCSFGLGAFPLLWLARHWTLRLEALGQEQR